MNTQKSAEEIELEAEEAKLRAEAEEISPARAEDATIPDPKSEAEERAAATDGEKTQKTNQRPGSDKKPDATGAAKPDASKTTKPGDKSTQAPGTKPGDKTANAKPGDTAAPDDSKLTPFQKERKRLDDTWKQVNADREQLKREREQIAAERQAWQQQQQQRQTPKQPSKIDGHTAEDWDAVAKDFEAEGKLALAQQARTKAKAARDADAAAPQGGAAAGPRERFSAEEVQQMTTQWQANLKKVGEENPELTQEGSPLRARVTELLKTTPLLHMSGDGILYAVEYAKLEAKAQQVDELTAKVGELEKENQRLMGLTSLPGGGAQPAAQGKKFDELTLDEQETALREEAANNVH